MSLQHGAGKAIIAACPGCPPSSEPADQDWTLYNFDGPILTGLTVGMRDGRAHLSLPEKTVHGQTDERVEKALRELSSPEGVAFFCRVGPRRAGDRQRPDTELRRLADAFPRTFWRYRRPHAGGLPSAFTYFGQFLAHELSNLGILNGGGQARSPALDLDSLFHVPPRPASTQEQAWAGGVGVGATHGTERLDQVSYADLPRRNNATAVIGDERNDHNLALAQMHVAISKFHHVVLDHCAGGDDATARELTTKHIQSIALHDYLPRVIDPVTNRDVVGFGRKMIYPGPDAPLDFLVPIEFAAACFRVGHSLIRDDYEPWNATTKIGNVDRFIEFTGEGGLIAAGAGLRWDWAVDWRLFVDGAEGQRTAQPAAAFDQNLPAGMFTLPSRLFASEVREGVETATTLSIAEMTLLRGSHYELCSAQELIARACDCGAAMPELLQGEIYDVPDRFAEARSLRSTMIELGVARDTPLWLYCLREADHLQNGRRFGPLAGRIVMETIHAAIGAAKHSIIAGGDGRGFRVHEALGGGREFTLGRMIDCVERLWRPPSKTRRTPGGEP